MAKKKKVTAPVAISERDWQARDDARTLAQAKTIMADKARLAKAAKEAAKMAEDKMTEAKAMKSIARKAK